jgi:hypothetical protein
MMSILDQVAMKRPLAGFRPTNARELLILRLAQKLGEPAAASHYAQLAAERSIETLLLAYRRAVNHGTPPRDVATRFHVELALAKDQDYRSREERLLAIKVERRSVAIAVFIGGKLDFHDVRNLSSQAEKAVTSALGFLRWVVGNYEIESATMERMTNGNEIRRAVLNQAVLDMLRSSGIPIWEASKRELLEAYSHPPLQSRQELRQAALSILWAMFNTDKPGLQEIDAGALGLHVQTERCFLV